MNAEKIILKAKFLELKNLAEEIERGTKPLTPQPQPVVFHLTKSVSFPVVQKDGKVLWDLVKDNASGWCFFIPESAIADWIYHAGEPLSLITARVAEAVEWARKVVEERRRQADKIMEEQKDAVIELSNLFAHKILSMLADFEELDFFDEVEKLMEGAWKELKQIGRKLNEQRFTSQTTFQITENITYPYRFENKIDWASVLETVRFPSRRIGEYRLEWAGYYICKDSKWEPAKMLQAYKNLQKIIKELKNGRV